ncbi:MAG: hypothetical protein WDO73_11350 [Ignavibacteriota bacterium]
MSDTNAPQGFHGPADFLLATTAAAGASLALGVNPIRAASLASNEVRVALIGAGAQGQVLLDASLQIPNVRFVAVCDIWTSTTSGAFPACCKDSGHPNRTYVDYKELLDKEKGPSRCGDRGHARFLARRARHRGHEGRPARSTARRRCRTTWRMPAAWCRPRARRAGCYRSVTSAAAIRAISSGYQRLLTEAKLLGRLTVANGQWNRAKRDFATIPATL